MAYVLDQRAWQLGAWDKALAHLGKRVRPFIAVFVSLDSPSSKQVRFICEELVPLIDSRFKTVADRGGRTVFGFGYSGLPAMATFSEGAELFGRMALQSAFISPTDANTKCDSTASQSPCYNPPAKLASGE